MKEREGGNELDVSEIGRKWKGKKVEGHRGKVERGKGKGRQRKRRKRERRKSMEGKETEGPGWKAGGGIVGTLQSMFQEFFKIFFFPRIEPG